MPAPRPGSSDALARPASSASRRVLVVGTVVLGCTLLGAGVGGGVATRYVPVQHATVDVLLNPLPGNAFDGSGGGDALLALQTEAQVVTSARVLDAVARELEDVPGAADLDLTQAISTEVPVNTQILRIEATSTEQATAADLATATATAFLASRRERTAASVAERVDQLTDQLRQTQQPLGAALSAARASRRGTAEHDLARGRVAQLTQEIGDLRSDLTLLDTTSGNPGQILSPATSLGAPAWQDPLVTTLGGAVLGMLVGAFLVLGRRSPLGSPRAGSARLDADEPYDERLALATLVDCSTAEDPRVARLRSSLLLLADDAPCTFLLVPVHEHLARTPTLLMPSLRAAALDAHLLDLGRADRAAESCDELASPAFAQHLAAVRAAHDVVVVVAPAAAEVATQTVVRLVDHVLLETTEGSSRRDVEDAVEAVRHWGGTVAGVVVVGDEDASETPGRLRATTGTTDRDPEITPRDVARQRA